MQRGISIILAALAIATWGDAVARSDMSVGPTDPHGTVACSYTVLPN